MRILYCNKYNFPFSGTESYLFEVMDLMRARGHEVALFSMADARGQPTPHDRHFVTHIDFKADSHVFAQARLAAHAIYSREARQRLRGMIAEFHPDVAHVRNIYHHLTPSIFWELKARAVPVIYHLNDFKLLCPSYNMVAHGQACERCKGGKFWNVLSEGCYAGSAGAKIVLAAEAYTHRWLRTYENCVDRFLAPSIFVKNKLVEHGWKADRIAVLPHFQRVSAAAAQEPARGAPILYFGRLSLEKGVSDLLQAMAKLPALRLSIAGDGPQRADLENQAKRLGVDNVEFLGHLSGADLGGRIASSRFTIFPSHAYETLGKSILESYGQGRAVVASDLGSRRELVEHGETGLLFPAGDVDRLVEAVSALAENPATTAAMGAAGKEFVRRHHSPDAHCIELTELYRQVSPCGGKTIAMPPVRSGEAPLRVAFIGGRGVISKYSGIETYYEEAGKRLAGMGHDVTVYCRSYFTPELRDYAGMRLIRLPTIRTKHLETAVHCLLSTVHAMFQGCDIVHYHALGPALFSFLPRLLGKKTVVTVQGLDWRREKWGRIASSVLRLGEQASFRLPNATMVVSRTLQEHYRSHYGLQASYVPNGTTIRKRQAPSQLVKWGIEPGNYILFLGRFSPEKNCHMLIDAFEGINTSAKLVLAGGSSHTDAYAAELRKRQSERIRVLEWVSGADLDELLTNAMLFVLPSDLEGLSLALLDAMGAGVCVLVSDIPENREVVDGAGFTFKAGDAADLAHMMEMLIAEPEVRSAVSKWVRERIRERYLWPQIAQQIGSTYRDLMGGRKITSITPEPIVLPKPREGKRKSAA